MTDLAKLVVALEAQSAKYVSELDRANRRLTKFEGDQNKTLRRMDADMRRFGRRVGGIFTGFLAGFSVAGVINATREAEEALALLDNAVKASGGSAGRTTQQLADMALELSRVSTFSDEAIMGAQQLLLRFQSIQGLRFDRALQSSLNLATVLRMDLAGAATLVGKALESPEKGIAQLTRRGVTFTAEQQKVIKALVDTGRTADAQKLILQQLEERFGGAAEAASNTFAGALAKLKNAAGELLEAKSGLPAVTESINGLTRRLQDPQLVDGLDHLASGLVRVGGVAVEAASDFGAFGELIGRGAASIAGMDEIDRLAGEIKDIDRAINNSFMGKPLKFITKNKDELKAMRAEVEAQIAALMKARDFGVFDEGDVKRAVSGGVEIKPSPLIIDVPDEPIEVPVEFKPIEEVEVTAKKLAQADPFGDWLQQLDDQTKTALQKEIDFLNQFEANLMVLQLEGVISPEEYAERWNEVLSSMITEVEVTATRIGQTMEKETTKLQQFMENAWRATSDFIGGVLEDAMGGSFDNILVDFEKMIARMVAEALKAQIGQWLFGAGGKGGGALSAVGNFVGGLFRDSGGRGQPGQAYMIGRGAQPEMFVPDEAGTFYPRDQWMGGGGVTQKIYVTGVIDNRTSRQIAMDAAKAQHTARARLGG